MGHLAFDVHKGKRALTDRHATILVRACLSAALSGLYAMCCKSRNE